MGWKFLLCFFFLCDFFPLLIFSVFALLTCVHLRLVSASCLGSLCFASFLGWWWWWGGRNEPVSQQEREPEKKSALINNPSDLHFFLVKNSFLFLSLSRLKLFLLFFFQRRNAHTTHRVRVNKFQSFICCVAQARACVVFNQSHSWRLPIILLGLLILFFSSFCSLSSLRLGSGLLIFNKKTLGSIVYFFFSHSFLSFKTRRVFVEEKSWPWTVLS